MESNPDPAMVLHSSLGVGHLVPMVDLAKPFLRHNIPAVITVPTPPAPTADLFASSAPAIASLTSANLSISFRRLIS
jgi:hypothetical protein